MRNKDFADYRVKQLTRKFKIHPATQIFGRTHSELSNGKKLNAETFCHRHRLQHRIIAAAELDEVGYIRATTPVALKKLPKSLIILARRGRVRVRTIFRAFAVNSYAHPA